MCCVIVSTLDLWCDSDAIFCLITAKGIPLEEIFNTLRTGDADLRFYINTVQDG